jgi:hypothetical protein
MLRKHHIFSRRMSISVVHRPPLAFLRSFACPVSSPYAFDIVHVGFRDEAIPSMQYINTHFLHRLLVFLPLTATSFRNATASPDLLCLQHARVRGRSYEAVLPLPRAFLLRYATCLHIPAIIADPLRAPRPGLPNRGLDDAQARVRRPRRRLVRQAPHVPRREPPRGAPRADHLDEREGTGWGYKLRAEADALRARFEGGLRRDERALHAEWPGAFRWTCCGTDAEMDWGCDHHGTGSRPCTCDFCRCVLLLLFVRRHVFGFLLLTGRLWIGWGRRCRRTSTISRTPPGTGWRFPAGLTRARSILPVRRLQRRGARRSGFRCEMWRESGFGNGTGLVAR